MLLLQLGWRRYFELCELRDQCMSLTRSLQAEISVLFDPTHYLKQLPSSEELLGTKLCPDAFTHYCMFGAAQALSPHPLFSPGYYLLQCPDSSEAKANPLVHYIVCGDRAFLSPHPLFNSAHYFHSNPDLFGLQKTRLHHYLEFGGAELRSPCAQFEPKIYLRNLPEDIRLLATRNPLLHFIANTSQRVATTRGQEYLQKRTAELAQKSLPEAVEREHPSSLDTLGVSPPLFSVVMPVYNTPLQLLEEAIGSVLNQDFKSWELCIADDCSTDPQVIELLARMQKLSPRIKVIRRTTNGHICAATNSALSLATGEWIVFMDHDDILYSHALESFYSEIKQSQATGFEPVPSLLYSDEEIISARGEPVAPQYKVQFCSTALLAFNTIGHLVAIRTSKFKEIGFELRLGFEGSQDFELVLRAFRAGVVFKHVPSILYGWRQHPGSVAGDVTSKPYAQLSALAAIQEHVDSLSLQNTVWVESQQNLFRYRMRRVLAAEEWVRVIFINDKSIPLREQWNAIQTFLATNDYLNVKWTSFGYTAEEHVALQKLVRSPSGHWPELLAKHHNSHQNVASENLWTLLFQPSTTPCGGRWLRTLLEAAWENDVGMIASPCKTKGGQGKSFTGPLPATEPEQLAEQLHVSGFLFDYMNFADHTVTKPASNTFLCKSEFLPECLKTGASLASESSAHPAELLQPADFVQQIVQKIHQAKFRCIESTQVFTMQNL